MMCCGWGQIRRQEIENLPQRGNKIVARFPIDGVGCRGRVGAVRSGADDTPFPQSTAPQLAGLHRYVMASGRGAA